MVPNIFQAFQVFMQNPQGFMQQQNLGIPQNIMNDPNKIIEYLMQNGKVSQQMYNQAAEMAKNFKKQ